MCRVSAPGSLKRCRGIMMLAWSLLFCRACVPHDTISTLICWAWGCGGGGKGGGDKAGGGWLLLASRDTSTTLGLLVGGAAGAEEAAAADTELGRALAGKTLGVGGKNLGIALTGKPELVGLALVWCLARIEPIAASASSSSWSAHACSSAISAWSCSIAFKACISWLICSCHSASCSSRLRA